MSAKALLERARESVRASSSKVTIDALAEQEAVVRFDGSDSEEEEEPSSSSSSRNRKDRRKNKKRAIDSIKPASVTTLGQDLSTALVDMDDERGSKWGKLPLTKSQLARTARANKARTAGSQWFDMPATPLTKETKRELQALRLLNTLDPKSFMKSSSANKDDKAFPEFFQVGYVLPDEQKASTAKRSDYSIARKKSFVEQLVEDEKARAFLKRKTEDVRAKGMSGKQKNHKKARKH